jgi:hypothetical protein
LDNERTFSTAVSALKSEVGSEEVISSGSSACGAGVVMFEGIGMETSGI